ncbi:ATP-binding protein [Yinghuangia sp. YIM S10712]|uniref:ATP-binding protein n=1 Tax=Yinghuangia sp. YIM S10712 TaxID=3436930 RepID=UPI003F535C7D
MAQASPTDDDWLSAAMRRDLRSGIELEWKREKTWPVQKASVSRARQLVDGALIDWWPVSSLRRDVRLCVSELVTNAVQHPEYLPEGACRSCTVTLRLRYRPKSFLIVEVDDWDRRPPRWPAGAPEVNAADPDSLPTSGRGLFLVDVFADGRDWRPWHLGGKTVRCWWNLTARGLATAFTARSNP